jgi:hypothetical protein
MKFQTYYDVLSTSEYLWFLPTLGLAIGVTLVVLGSYKKFTSLRVSENKMRWWVKGIFLCLLFLLATSGLQLFKSIQSQKQSKHWLSKGAFEVVEGPVTHFRRAGYSKDNASRTFHPYESFKVKGIPFEYADLEVSKGGFHKTTLRGGPIREGLMVRITYHGNIILKLEIPNQSGN